MENLNPKSSALLTVYYDGLCHLCSREIEMYRGLKGSERIHFVDITDSSFDAMGEGLDPVKVHKTLHSKDEVGKIHSGVETFILIWERIDKFKKLVPFARIKAVRRILDFGYFGFALVRPLLPKKSCQNSPYCEINKN